MQTGIVDTLTYNTSRRSAGLRFAAASHGAEVDPDVEVFKRRVLAIRRARVVGRDNKRLVDEILQQHLEK